MSDAINIRRTGHDIPQVGDYFSSERRYYNQLDEMLVVNVRSGEYYVTEGQNEMMVTILGSCVAACIYDPVAKIAGLNHFLMPGDFNVAASPKYGIFAMEYMINDILKGGGVKTRLEVKIFGGANVTKNITLQIGQKNIDFVKEYLINENLKLVASDVGGECPRRVHFMGDTGKVMIRKLLRTDDVEKVNKEEKRFSHELEKGRNKPTDSSIELFGD